MSTGSQRLPQFSISQVSTLTASFADDVRTYPATGPVVRRRRESFTYCWEERRVAA